jgi:hypothetical protein
MHVGITQPGVPHSCASFAQEWDSTVVSRADFTNPSGLTAAELAQQFGVKQHLTRLLK